MAEGTSIHHSHSVAPADPFNWPMLKRQDLMSLQTLGAQKDLVRVKTAKVVALRGNRGTSQNLMTQDITGIVLFHFFLFITVGA